MKIGFSPKTRFVFRGGAPESPAEGERRIKADVQKELDWYLKEIDVAENDPARIEALIEGALKKLGEKYENKIEEGWRAQRAGLEMLVNRACDINGDGQINTPQERTLLADIKKKLDPVHKELFDAAHTALTRIRETGQLAREMKREAEKGVGIFEDNDLADSDDPKVRDAYKKFTDAQGTLAKKRQEYGLALNIPLNEDDVLMVLDRQADLGKKDYKVARLRGQLPARAAAIVAELKGHESAISARRGELIQAIDKWEKQIVAQARTEYKGKRVEAKDLAQQIDFRKMRLIEEEERAAVLARTKEWVGGEKGKAEGRLVQLEYELGKAEERVDVAENYKDMRESELRNKKAEYGLAFGAEINEDNILVALDGLADRGRKEYRVARLKGQLPARAAQIVAELKGYEQRYNAAWTKLKEAQYAVAQLEGDIGKQKRVVAGVRKEAEGHEWVAERLPQTEKARGKMKKKKDTILAQREAERRANEPALANIPSAPTAPAAAVRAPEVAGEKTYVVKRGDNMWKILTKFYPRDQVNQNLADAIQKYSLGEVRKLKDGKSSLIEPGQVIKIPQSFTYAKNGRNITVNRLA